MLWSVYLLFEINKIPALLEVFWQPVIVHPRNILFRFYSSIAMLPASDCSLSSPLATVSDSAEESVSLLARNDYIVLPEMTTVVSGLYLLC